MCSRDTYEPAISPEAQVWKVVRDLSGDPDSSVQPIRMVPQNDHDLIHAFEMSGGDIPLVLEE